MSIGRPPLVLPLDDAFREVLDAIARARGYPTSSDHGRLGALVRKLSDVYNDAAGLSPRGSEALAARLVFSFARDCPKGAAAVRELVAAGLLDVPRDRPLRVLDVGAGLGAAARGVVRALAASGASGVVAVEAIDSDTEALELAAAIARARPTEGGVRVEWRSSRGLAGESSASRGPYDLIVLGQVLSELDRGVAGRVEVHASLLASYAALLAPDGSLVVIEPALRDRTRHLHAVRDAALARKADRALNVFAPCVHDEPCPILVSGEGWCHEDLDVDLPDWLVPTARAAGLRWQGLTFSYLVLRQDGERYGRRASVLSAPQRVVSSPLVTKGKRELFVCGPFPDVDGAAVVKVMRLDRHASEQNAAWSSVARGDVLEIVPRPTRARPRVEASTEVMLASPGARPPVGD